MVPECRCYPGPRRHEGEAGAREAGECAPSRSRSPSESSNARFRVAEKEEGEESEDFAS